MSSVANVLNGLPSASARQERMYKDLHAHPELSFQETRTAALAAAKLKDLGYEVLEQIGHTGVVGILRNGTGQTVLARADMDALPVKERTAGMHPACTPPGSTFAPSLLRTRAVRTRSP